MGSDMPAHGLFLRNIKGMDVSNVEFALTNNDARPAIWAQNVRGLDIFRVKSPTASGPSNFVLKDVKDFHLAAARGAKDMTLEDAPAISF